MSAQNAPDQASPAGKGTDRKKKLGRGLGALMGETRTEAKVDLSSEGGTIASADAAKGGLASLPVASIEPLPGQPRTHFDEDALEELAASIAQRGVIQPIIVRPLAGGRYQLVAGERRWRAAQKARLHQIPAIVRELEEREIMALALIENIQREDLNPVEEAQAYQQLADKEGLSQKEIGKLVDKSRSHVANLQRLLQLPQSVRDLVVQGALSMGHARALIGNEDAERLAKEAVAKGLTVRDMEKLAKGAGTRKQKSRGATSQPSNDNADIRAVQDELEACLGLSVKITADADPKSGAVTIRYKSLDQLDMLCQRLSGGEI
ncbi:ParB/RepB/Spo0J family partition protein [Qipengyuania sp. JC766]|uniref:ParB/RepB/Spo0J family partition protein n=1 Tax=Qipengyuania sp. JC766 TaxID=3232139 RepID=UPI0034587E9D